MNKYHVREEPVVFRKFCFVCNKKPCQMYLHNDLNAIRRETKKRNNSSRVERMGKDLKYFIISAL